MKFIEKKDGAAAALYPLLIGAKLFGCDLFKPEGADLPFEWIPLEALRSRPLTVEWVTMSHVIEHLTSPSDALTLVRHLLGKDGGLCITTPNAQSVLISSFGKLSRDVDFPRHRQVFSRRSLEAMLNDTGFSVQFLSPPRINAALNFFACAKNAIRARENSGARTVAILIAAGLRLLMHLAAPAQIRNRTSPELYLIASPKQRDAEPSGAFLTER